MEKSINLDHMTLGVCYYPEHWDESLWEDDLNRMAALGIETVRVFEFAWNLVEPSDGVFDFSLFDRFLGLCARKGMKAIMCTPTATPPAWLSHAYPEILNAKYDGTVYAHGHRRHYNYNSKVYRFYSERIVTRLAEHFGQHPAIIGWQIDNELNCEINVFYSDSDREAFRSYLKAHFGTLEAFNEAIGSRFWNMTYTDWAEVDLRRPTANDRYNPHLELLEKRFFSKSAIGYARLHANILRKYIGDRFITTNGLFGHLDNHEMTNTALDFLTFDSYPNFAYGNRMVEDTKARRTLGDREWSMKLTTVRSISPNFGIMEQQAGPGGSNQFVYSPTPKPGMMRLWALQSVAHGADFVSFFRWRTAPYGEEIYWHGLNDYSNLPNRRLKELERIHRDFVALDGLPGSHFKADVALVCDYLNEWDGEHDCWHGQLDSASRAAIFRAAQESHTPLDMVYIRSTNTHRTKLEELTRYKALIYPHATILTEDTADLLKRYCEAGGRLYMGARTGYKDEDGHCPMRPMPGFARELCGVEVTDYTFVRAEEPPVTMVLDGEVLTAPIFNDVLRPVEGGEVMAAFDSAYYRGEPAIIRRTYPGGGEAWYVGSGFSRETTLALLKRCGALSPFAGAIECPADIELTCREKDGRQFIFLLNYSAETCAVKLNGRFRNLLDGENLSGEVTFPAYEVKVLIHND